MKATCFSLRKTRQSIFTVESPPGTYGAPGPEAMACGEAIQRFNRRSPHQLQYPDCQALYFNGQVDTIFLDARALFVLSDIRRRINDADMTRSHGPVPSPLGFELIEKLATPLQHNDFVGMASLRSGYLEGVRDPITVLANWSLPGAMETVNLSKDTIVSCGD